MEMNRSKTQCSNNSAYKNNALQKLFLEKAFSDVTINIFEKYYKLHKAILGGNSEFFMNMFLFNEEGSYKLTELPFDENAWNFFLNGAYNLGGMDRYIIDLSFSSLTLIFQMVDYFDVRRLKAEIIENKSLIEWYVKGMSWEPKDIKTNAQFITFLQVQDPDLSPSLHNIIMMEAAYALRPHLSHFGFPTLEYIFGQYQKDLCVTSSMEMFRLMQNVLRNHVEIDDSQKNIFGNLVLGKPQFLLGLNECEFNKVVKSEIFDTNELLSKAFSRLQHMTGSFTFGGKISSSDELQFRLIGDLSAFKCQLMESQYYSLTPNRVNAITKFEILNHSSSRALYSKNHASNLKGYFPGYNFYRVEFKLTKNDLW